MFGNKKRIIKLENDNDFLKCELDNFKSILGRVNEQVIKLSNFVEKTCKCEDFEYFKIKTIFSEFFMPSNFSSDFVYKKICNMCKKETTISEKEYLDGLKAKEIAKAIKVLSEEFNTED